MRRIQRTAIGPTGAAIASPIRNPFQKNAISTAGEGFSRYASACPPALFDAPAEVVSLQEVVDRRVPGDRVFVAGVVVGVRQHHVLAPLELLAPVIGVFERFLRFVAADEHQRRHIEPIQFRIAGPLIRIDQDAK